MIIRSKAGWPVEVIKGKPVQAIIRKIIHGNVHMSWKLRHES